MDHTALGERIRTMRRARKLTQVELGELTNISPSFIGHIERGTRVMSVETLMALSHALECTPNELLGVESAPVEPNLPQLLRAMADLLENRKTGAF